MPSFSETLVLNMAELLDVECPFMMKIGEKHL